MNVKKKPFRLKVCEAIGLALVAVVTSLVFAVAVNGLQTVINHGEQEALPMHWLFWTVCVAVGIAMAVTVYQFLIGPLSYGDQDRGER